jgi:hypothetical protein
MTPEIADLVITDFLKTMSAKLDNAVQIAKAAEACADAGNPQKAIEIIMDVEQLMFDANTLLNGAGLLKLRFQSDAACDWS